MPELFALLRHRKAKKSSGYHDLVRAKVWAALIYVTSMGICMSLEGALSPQMACSGLGAAASSRVLCCAQYALGPSFGIAVSVTVLQLPMRTTLAAETARQARKRSGAPSPLPTLRTPRPRLPAAPPRRCPARSW